jgi:hypothetical protein
MFRGADGIDRTVIEYEFDAADGAESPATLEATTVAV